MGELLIILIVLGILVIIGQVLLYLKRFGDKRGVWIQNILLNLLIGFISYTSFPDNYTASKMIALVLFAAGVVGFIMSIVGKKTTMGAKLLISISVIGGYLFLIFSI
ncbi:hypothetical protein ABZ756_05200 [Mammaliicoccus sciuri]|uniref:hypothetical protein n=1 Tax=unclassified Sporosarcina TaxID=2647733 RepID=UPI0030FA988D